MHLKIHITTITYSIVVTLITIFTTFFLKLHKTLPLFDYASPTAFHTFAIDVKQQNTLGQEVFSVSESGYLLFESHGIKPGGHSVTSLTKYRRSDEVTNLAELEEWVLERLKGNHSIAFWKNQKKKQN